jgi:hypothetical protein
MARNWVPSICLQGYKGYAHWDNPRKAYILKLYKLKNKLQQIPPLCFSYHKHFYTQTLFHHFQWPSVTYLGSVVQVSHSLVAILTKMKLPLKFTGDYCFLRSRYCGHQYCALLGEKIEEWWWKCVPEWPATGLNTCHHNSLCELAKLTNLF